MNEQERWDYIIALDEELLKGGVLHSEWCTYQVRECDVAFVYRAHLATIILAVAAMETYLQSEYSGGGADTFNTLIEKASLDESLKQRVHELRRYRNRWVHVKRPWDDSELFSSEEKVTLELEAYAMKSVRVLREILYLDQCV